MAVARLAQRQMGRLCVQFVKISPKLKLHWPICYGEGRQGPTAVSRQSWLLAPNCLGKHVRGRICVHVHKIRYQYVNLVVVIATK